jgi:hypothetical protein
MARNCFGKLARDSGHSRVPDPPDRITGTIIGQLRFDPILAGRGKLSLADKPCAVFRSQAIAMFVAQFVDPLPRRTDSDPNESREPDRNRDMPQTPSTSH